MIIWYISFICTLFLCIALKFYHRYRFFFFFKLYIIVLVLPGFCTITKVMMQNCSISLEQTTFTMPPPLQLMITPSNSWSFHHYILSILNIYWECCISKFIHYACNCNNMVCKHVSCSLLRSFFSLSIEIHLGCCMNQ